MKRKLIIIALALFSFGISKAQIGFVMRGTVVSNAANQVTVYGKSSVAITDKHTDNVVVSVSIVDPGVGNRPTLSIVTNHLPDVAWIPASGSPYLEGGRYHYDFIAVNTISTPSVSTITFLADRSYPLITLGFSNSNGFASARLDHWDAPNFGATSFSQFYFQIQQAGGGDITAQSNLFYGTVAVVNDPGGWNSGTSFAPLQPLSVVPVKFTAFSATKKDNDALLTWTVENEIATTDRYEIERSIDGNTFDKIATLARNVNNTNTSKTYNTIDPNLSTTKKSGLIYYRIKQLDLDGRVVYSDIRFVRMGDNGGISVFPNPAHDFTNLSIDATNAGLVVIDLVSADGKQISTNSMQVQKGTNIKRISTNNLPAGTYLMRIKIENEIQVIKLTKL